MPDEPYLCQLSASPADQSSVILLGCCSAKNRRLALRWIKDQAHRVARALDPDPFDWWVANAPLHLVDSSLDLPDPAQEFRMWAENAREQETAMCLLDTGQVYSFTTYDMTTYYYLSAWPAAVASEAELRDIAPVCSEVA